MMQRIITGLVLVAVLGLLLYLGGSAFGLMAMLAICFSVHEEYRALTIAGHRPVSWPTWVAVVLSVPMAHFLGGGALAALLMVTCLLTIAHVLFRSEPRLEDALMSMLPMISILVPGLCVVSITQVQPIAVQRMLLCVMAMVPVLGDTMAYFVGTAIGGPKFCPAVSPNKTVAGAIGGLCGSVVGAGAVGVITFLCCGPETQQLLPAWWQYLLLGILGGAASQLGDLFASLVKRHCGIKDFSNLFPGHGGMLDRVDSMLFMAVVVFCARAMGM